MAKAKTSAGLRDWKKAGRWRVAGEEETGPEPLRSRWASNPPKVGFILRVKENHQRIPLKGTRQRLKQTV